MEYRVPLAHSTELFAQFAHEARQPISAARCALEVLRTCAAVDQRERAFAMLDRQLTRLSRFVDDLLDESGLELGKTTLQTERLDLRGLVEDVTESVRSQIAEKQQSVDTQLPENPVWVEADPARLQQVVSNLLLNGVRYTGLGGRLSLDVSEGPNEAVLKVRDTGRGIPADLLPHVFEPFRTGGNGSEHGLAGC